MEDFDKYIVDKQARIDELMGQVNEIFNEVGSEIERRYAEGEWSEYNELGRSIASLTITEPEYGEEECFYYYPQEWETKYHDSGWVSSTSLC